MPAITYKSQLNRRERGILATFIAGLVAFGVLA